MSSNELSAAIDSWRRLVDTRVAKSLPEEKAHSQQLAMLKDALDVAKPYLVPSATGLFGQLAQIIQAWKAEWTNELSSSPTWTLASGKLAQIRQLIVDGDLPGAEFELGDLLLRGSAGVRSLDLSVSVRHLSEDEVNDPVSTSSKESLLELVDWLESF